MRYGFVIDNRLCIGCHACSVACKAENQVPLGVFRTWVKSVDKGRFPDTRRHFQVTRCNHCDNPPCVAVCPVAAIYRRRDGIVDFDPGRCIGCKACLQACPYDAVYIDPERRTAAKCHFCAHRVEVGMEPACVSACPQHAILVGDIDDPSSEVSRALRSEPVTVRRPELGTSPKVFYVAAEETAIVPGRADNVGAYLFGTVNPGMRSLRPLAPAHQPPPGGVPMTPAIVTYDVEHDRPWGGDVAAYLWAKSVAGGALVVPALAHLAGGAVLSRHLEAALCLGALLFLGLTTGLLVSDLSRPERFLRALSTPQARSWVARGAYLLVLYGALCAGLFGSSVAGAAGLSTVLLWPTVLGGLLAAVYTAFLLRQCKGRDLWQGPLLPLTLTAQCVVASGAFLALLPAGLGVTAPLRHAAALALAVGILAHAAGVGAELAMHPAGSRAREASGFMVRGPLATLFWAGLVGVGCALPAVLLAVSTTSAVLVGLAGAGALAGLLAFDWCFVMAGQGPANS